MQQAIYNNSPVFIQNILTSLYGLKLKKQRYGKTFKAVLPVLINNYALSSQEIQQLQLCLLKEALQHAKNTVPYYINHFNDLPVNEITLENFTSYIPVIDKNVLRQRSNEFVSNDPGLGKIITINTSGTTGTPLNIRTNIEAMQTNYAFFARMLHIAGVEIGQPSVTFAGRIFISENKKHVPFWRKNYFMNNTLFSSYDISAATIPYYIAELERLNVAFIDSYPSAIYEIANFINTNNITHTIQPTAIITSSETLLDYQRQEIETAFSTKVYDHYGCAEMAALFTQCKYGKYHINSDFSIVEILDDNDLPVKENDSGNLVCTSFINKSMPLIRYKIGDNATYTTEKCQCGCNFPIIKSLEGRTDDLILTVDGNKVGRLDPVFKGLSGIKETQIIQEEISQLRVILVVSSDFNNADEQKLSDNLKLRVGKDMKIRFEYTDKIPKTKSGKFKSVVSHLRTN